MHTNVDSSIADNRQDMETTQVPISRRTGREALKDTQQAMTEPLKDWNFAICNTDCLGGSYANEISLSHSSWGKPATVP